MADTRHSSNVPRLIHYEYERPGKGVDTYDHWLVRDDRHVAVLYMPEYKGPDAVYGRQLAINTGGSVLWFVFPGDVWFDVGAFYSSEQALMGWYTNLCTPYQRDDSHWRARDLFLDHWYPVVGTPVWVDEDELTKAIEDGVLSDAEVARIARTRVELEDAVSGDWPPAVVHDVDLKLAKSKVERGTM